MHTHSEIFAIRDTYVGHYRNYLTGLSGSLLESLINQNIPPPAKVERVNSATNRLLGDFVHVVQPIQQDLQALVEPDNDPLALTFVSELSHDLIVGLSDVARREAKNVSRLALEVLMGVANPSSDGTGSILGLLERRMRVMDSRGRQWRSERYVAILVQHTLFKAVNESTLYRAKPNSRFRVIFNEPNKEPISLRLEDYRSPDYRDKIFHPNSSALVIEIA